MPTALLCIFFLEDRVLRRTAVSCVKCYISSIIRIIIVLSWYIIIIIIILILIYYCKVFDLSYIMHNDPWT
jgi:ABC-type multidrug transport system permease subunit